MWYYLKIKDSTSYFINQEIHHVPHPIGAQLWSVRRHLSWPTGGVSHPPPSVACTSNHLAPRKPGFLEGSPRSGALPLACWGWRARGMPSTGRWWWGQGWPWQGGRVAHRRKGVWRWIPAAKLHSSAGHKAPPADVSSPEPWLADCWRSGHSGRSPCSSPHVYLPDSDTPGSPIPLYGRTVAPDSDAHVFGKILKRGRLFLMVV